MSGFAPFAQPASIEPGCIEPEPPVSCARQKRQKASMRMTPRTAFIHEDDDGTIELLPLRNWAHCESELTQLNAFSEQHRAPDGLGWTDVYRLAEPPASVSALVWALDDVSALLAPHLAPFDRVETGYSSHREPCENLRAFGIDAGCAIVVQHDADAVVQRIWLGLSGPAEPAQSSLLSALAALAAQAELLFVDWGWERLLRLDDGAGLADYLREREAYWHRQ